MNKKNFFLIFLSIFCCIFSTTYTAENPDKQKVIEEIIYKQLMHIHTKQKINIKTIQPILNTYKQYTVTHLYDIIKARRDELSHAILQLDIKEGTISGIVGGLIVGGLVAGGTLISILATQISNNSLTKEMFFKRAIGLLIIIGGCKLLFNTGVSIGVKILLLKWSKTAERTTLDQILYKLENIILLERIKEAQDSE